MSGRALEFAILTAARSGEVREATWGEIDLTSKVWTIPAGRMKGAIEHRVALSPDAVKLLKKLPSKKGSDAATLVFPAPRGAAFSDMTLTALIRRMHATRLKINDKGWRDPDGRVITAHGFRATFKTWGSDVTSYQTDVIEHAMAHQLKDKAEAAYERGTMFDKRRRLMDDWAAYCNTVQGKSDNVVSIKSKTAA